jgi:hypothetical protein
MNQDYPKISFSKIPQQQNFLKSSGLTRLAPPEGRDFPSEARKGSVSDRSSLVPVSVSYRPVTEFWFKKEKENWIKTGVNSSTLEARPKGVLSDSYLKPKAKKPKAERLVPLKPFFTVDACDNLHNPKFVSLCSCNDIFRCKVCEIKRMKEAQKDFRDFMIAANIDKPKNQTMKMLTLTLKREFDFKTDRERLLKAFTRLRHRKDWKNKVSFYKGRMEVVENNIHLHIVLTSLFWNQKEISNAWLECTGNSYIVDIRKVNDVEKASLELAKYVCKDTNEDLKMELAEFRDDNKGSRFVFTGRRPPSLDTIATSRQTEIPKCECCGENRSYHGQFGTPDEAEKWVKAQVRDPDGHIRRLSYPKKTQNLLQ